MNTEIRPPLHTTLSYTILIMVVVTFTNTFVAPAVQKRKTSFEALSSLQEQNSRFLQAINQLEYSMNEQEVMPSSPDEEAEYSERFLHATTPALAAAELQSQLRALIANKEAELISAVFKRRTEESVFPIITVNIRARSSIASLQEILYEIEIHPLALFVENLMIQSRHQPGRIIQSMNEELEIRLDVTGYLVLQDSGE